jgi:hypothetical protein
MFVAIYRWRLHADREQDFIINWQRITLLGLAAGSGGSSLFKDAQGCWVAIARWPSNELRNRFFEQVRRENAEPEMAERARLAILESLPAQELTTVLDHWATLPDGIAEPLR